MTEHNPGNEDVFPDNQEELERIRQAYNSWKQANEYVWDEGSYSTVLRFRQSVEAVLSLRESGHLKREEMPS